MESLIPNSRYQRRHQRPRPQYDLNLKLSRFPPHQQLPQSRHLTGGEPRGRAQRRLGRQRCLAVPSGCLHRTEHSSPGEVQNVCDYFYSLAALNNWNRPQALILGCRQLLTPYYHPQVNGKVERFNRTLLEEWAYVHPYTGVPQLIGGEGCGGATFEFAK